MEIRTRHLEDPVFEEAIRKSIACPQCGKTMRLKRTWYERGDSVGR